MLCLVTQLCPTLCDPMDCSPPGSSVHFPGRNTGVGCHSLFQGIFPTQRSNPLPPHWQAGSLPLSHQGSSRGHRPPPQRHPLFVGYASQHFQMLVMRQWRVPPHTVAEQSHILGGQVLGGKAPPSHTGCFLGQSWFEIPREATKNTSSLQRKHKNWKSESNHPKLGVPKITLL